MNKSTFPPPCIYCTEKEVFHSPVVQTNERHSSILTRFMQSKAVGDVELGMLIVGNVGVNRVLASKATRYSFSKTSY